MKIGLMMVTWMGVAAISATGCGDDSGSSTDSSAMTEGGSTATGATDSGGSTLPTTGTSEGDSSGGGSSGGGDTGSTGDTGGLMVVCGDGQVCDAGDVCVEEVFDPPCDNYDPKVEMCPVDTVPSQCGGAGIPCCCGPAAPSVFTCLTPTDCTGTPDCECLGDICEGEKMCQELGSKTGGTFQCVTPPAA